MLVPKVVQNYIGQFPETNHNAYNYFNYDHRVVNERAETRFDTQSCYKGPQDLSNEDFDVLVKYAKSLLNPVLLKYSPKLACEDALHIAIKSFDNGLFDGKINANRYNVLLAAMQQPEMICPSCSLSLPDSSNPVQTVMAKLKEQKDKPVPHRLLKQLGIKPKDVPLHYQVHNKLQKGMPHFEKHPGKGILVKK